MKKSEPRFIAHTLNASDEFIKLMARAIYLSTLSNRKPVSLHIMIGDYLVENSEFPEETDEIDTLSYLNTVNLSGDYKITLRLRADINKILQERRSKYKIMADQHLTTLQAIALVMNEIVQSLHMLEDG